MTQNTAVIEALEQIPAPAVWILAIGSAILIGVWWWYINSDEASA